MTCSRGTSYLLCSDGLTDMISDEQIAEVLQGTNDLQEAGTGLIAAANGAGGRDNIAVVLVRAQGTATTTSRSWWPFKR